MTAPSPPAAVKSSWEQRSRSAPPRCRIQARIPGAEIHPAPQAAGARSTSRPSPASMTTAYAPTSGRPYLAMVEAEPNLLTARRKTAASAIKCCTKSSAWDRWNPCCKMPRSTTSWLTPIAASMSSAQANWRRQTSFLKTKATSTTSLTRSSPGSGGAWTNLTRWWTPPGRRVTRQRDHSAAGGGRPCSPFAVSARHPDARRSAANRSMTRGMMRDSGCRREAN